MDVRSLVGCGRSRTSCLHVLNVSWVRFIRFSVLIEILVPWLCSTTPLNSTPVATPTLLSSLISRLFILSDPSACSCSLLLLLPLLGGCEYRLLPITINVKSIHYLLHAAILTRAGCFPHWVPVRVHNLLFTSHQRSVLAIISAILMGNQFE